MVNGLIINKMTEVLFPPEKYVDGLALNLLNQDSRIMVYDLYGNLQEDAGYIPTKTQIIFPVRHPSANHQIAHIVEMKNSSRWTMIDWGMSNKFDELNGRHFFAALSREIRVRAIELHMNNEFNNKKSSRYFIFNNYVWEDATIKFLPFGRFSSLAQVHAWANDLRDRTYYAWNVERIRHEWSTRLNHIRNWMETN